MVKLDAITLKILRELMMCPLNPLQLSQRLEKPYALVWGRIENMKERGLISYQWAKEKEGRGGKGKRCKLTSLGLVYVISETDSQVLVHKLGRIMKNYKDTLPKILQSWEYFQKVKVAEIVALLLVTASKWVLAEVECIRIKHLYSREQIECRLPERTERLLYEAFFIPPPGTATGPIEVRWHRIIARNDSLYKSFMEILECQIEGLSRHQRELEEMKQAVEEERKRAISPSP